MTNKTIEKPISAAYIFPGTKAINYFEKDLMEDICKYFKVSVKDITGSSRKRKFVEARQVCMYFLRKRFPDYTLGYIGSLMNKNHSTVLYACSLVKDLMFSTPEFKNMIDDINCMIISRVLILDQENGVSNNEDYTSGAVEK